MTKEQIDKLHDLEHQRYAIERRLGYMKNWGEELFLDKDRETENFNIAIYRSDRMVLHREATRAEAEEMYNAEDARLHEEIARIDAKIAEL